MTPNANFSYCFRITNMEARWNLRPLVFFCGFSSQLICACKSGRATSAEHFIPTILTEHVYSPLYLSLHYRNLRRELRKRKNIDRSRKLAGLDQSHRSDFESGKLSLLHGAVCENVNVSDDANQTRCTVLAFLPSNAKFRAATANLLHFRLVRRAADSWDNPTDFLRVHTGQKMGLELS
jgi:hypothetical protein